MAKFIDITGNVYGNLTVLYPTEKKISRNGKRWYLHWLCKCTCGNEKEANGQTLKAFLVKSCGCLGPMISQVHSLTDEKDLEGMKFGKLNVIRRDFDNLGKGTHCWWLCRCDCGKEKIINSQNLQRAKSCGCLKKKFSPSSQLKKDRDKIYYERNKKKIMESQLKRREKHKIFTNNYIIEFNKNKNI